jgi:sugar phosphate isomerase/epimerase
VTLASPGSRLGLDSQTMFGMPPVDHIAIAAELGCANVSLGPSPVPWKLDRFPVWSLLDDAPLRRETRAALRDTGVTFALADGFTIRSTTEAGERAAHFDMVAELGARRVCAVSMEADPVRALDQMAILAELADERGMRFVFEFAPPHTFGTLDKAYRAVKDVGRANTGLLIDTMHLVRTGATAADLARIPPEAVGYVQVSDAPLLGDGPDYYEEACFERMLPGEGEIPLGDILTALPADLPVGLEIPMQSAIRAADDLRIPLGRIVEAGKRLLAGLAIA